MVVGPLPFLGVHGVGVDNSGRLLAGSVLGASLSQVDSRSGQVKVLIGPPEGMADDLAFGPDGQIAWTSYLSGVLRARTNNGPVQVLAENLPGINSLAYNSEGRLFATQVFLGDALYEIDPAGKKPPLKILENMGGLNGFDFGPDGRLYGPLWFKGQIARIDVEKGTLEVVAEGFKTPAAANFDSKGNLYVVDTSTGELIKVDIKTGDKTKVAQLKTSLDNLAIDAEDRIYVSNMADNSIQEVSANNGEIRTIVSSELAAPSGIAIADGTLYIADVFAFRTMNLATKSIQDVARAWASDIEYPNNVSVSDNSVILSGMSTGAVQIVDRKSLKTIRMLHGFQGPTATIELPDESLLIAEYGTDSLVRVDGAKGEIRSPVVTELQGPAGLALGDEGQTVYITTTAGIIWAVDTKTWSKRKLAEGLKLPEGVALTPEGHVMIVESGVQRLVEIDPKKGNLKIVAKDLPLGLPPLPGLSTTVHFSGVAIDKDGHIYVTTDREGALYKIPREAHPMQK
jgi:sugar lactone lactonase YvrE